MVSFGKFARIALLGLALTPSFWMSNAVARNQPSASQAAGVENSWRPIDLYAREQRAQSFDACTHVFPAGKPLATSVVDARLKPTQLCSDGFAVVYSKASKTPLVVVEKISSSTLSQGQGLKRTDKFFPDPRLSRSDRAELADYRKQTPAVDRGHMAAAANSFSDNAMAQSFALSNILPQSPESNRKAWADIEKATRQYAKRAKGDVFVFSGPLFSAEPEKIGKSQVWVPSYLYKLVYDASSGRAWAFLQPNGPGPVNKPISYAAFVEQTGMALLDGLPVTAGNATR